MVVLVDGFERGVRVPRLGSGEGFVGVAPFLGKVEPGDGAGEETGCWGDGGGRGVEGKGGLGGQSSGDGGAPVDDGAEDL